MSKLCLVSLEELSESGGTSVIGLDRASICITKQLVCEVLDVYSESLGVSYCFDLVQVVVGVSSLCDNDVKQLEASWSESG